MKFPSTKNIKNIIKAQPAAKPVVQKKATPQKTKQIKKPAKKPQAKSQSKSQQIQPIPATTKQIKALKSPIKSIKKKPVLKPVVAKKEPQKLAPKIAKGKIEQSTPAKNESAKKESQKQSAIKQDIKSQFRQKYAETKLTDFVMYSNNSIEHEGHKLDTIFTNVLENIYPKTEPPAASSSNQKIKTTFYEPKSNYNSDQKPNKRKEDEQKKEWDEIRRHYQEIQHMNDSKKSTPKKQEFNIKIDQASLQSIRSLLKK